MTPDIELKEEPYNLGQLGDLDEPLLTTAIQAITGVSNHQNSAAQKKANDQAIDFVKLPAEDEKGYFISKDPFKGLPLKPTNFEFQN